MSDNSDASAPSHKIKLSYKGSDKVVSVEATMRMEDLWVKIKELLRVSSASASMFGLFITSPSGSPTTVSLDWEMDDSVRDKIPNLSKVVVVERQAENDCEVVDADGNPLPAQVDTKKPAAVAPATNSRSADKKAAAVAPAKLPAAAAATDSQSSSKKPAAVNAADKDEEDDYCVVVSPPPIPPGTGQHPVSVSDLVQTSENTYVLMHMVQISDDTYCLMDLDSGNPLPPVDTKKPTDLAPQGNPNGKRAMDTKKRTAQALPRCTMRATTAAQPPLKRARPCRPVLPRPCMFGPPS